ncbi:hypothetical protein LCGC14_2592360 [marine sediment metagenome]|uniref:Uncharacterized protein n=1 Tax=marine sediment metagenome TaxID=412755 RepID=A0A0F9CMD1_9ZZZZ
MAFRHTFVERPQQHGEPWNPRRDYCYFCQRWRLDAIHAEGLGTP